METVLTFTLTLVDGTIEEQKISVPPDKAEAAVMQMLQQFAVGGLLRKDEVESTFHFIPCHQIARVVVDLPKLTLASSTDIRTVSKAAANMKQIIPG